jgi:hypothetical protein
MCMPLLLAAVGPPPYCCAAVMDCEVGRVPILGRLASAAAAALAAFLCRREAVSAAA